MLQLVTTLELLGIIQKKIKDVTASKKFLTQLFTEQKQINQIYI